MDFSSFDEVLHMLVGVLRNIYIYAKVKSHNKVCLAMDIAKERIEKNLQVLERRKTRLSTSYFKDLHLNMEIFFMYDSFYYYFIFIFFLTHSLSSSLFANRMQVHGRDDANNDDTTTTTTRDDDCMNNKK